MSVYITEAMATAGMAYCTLLDLTSIAVRVDDQMVSVKN